MLKDKHASYSAVPELIYYKHIMMYAKVFMSLSNAVLLPAVT